MVKRLIKDEEEAEQVGRTAGFSLSYIYGEQCSSVPAIHDNYEIYFFVSDGMQFIINDKCYNIESGDIFVINDFETHFIVESKHATTDRIKLEVQPEFLARQSSLCTDLCSCFNQRGSGHSNKIKCSNKQQQNVLYMLQKLSSCDEYGADLLKNAYFIELMVLINQLFVENDSEYIGENYYLSDLNSKVIEYINNNITKDISLASIASNVEFSQSHICRHFKSELGITINKFIVARRVAIAKKLIALGLSVGDVYDKCGFNDYSNFIKSFESLTGYLPKAYSKMSEGRP